MGVHTPMDFSGLIGHLGLGGQQVQVFGQPLGQQFPNIPPPLCTPAPLFGRGVDGVVRLLEYEDQVLGIDPPVFAVERETRVDAPVDPGPVLRGCVLCRIAGWLSR